MTISELHQSFRFRLDKLDSLNYPNFLSEEIDLLLNQAQERFIKQRYGSNNIKRTSFEETEKRIEDLKEIIETVQLVPNNFANLFFIKSKEDSTGNSYTVDLTTLTDHWFTIWDKAIISHPTCNTSITLQVGNYGSSFSSSILVNGIEVEVRSITHLELEKVKKDPFKGPDKTKILKLMHKNRVELIPPNNCTVQYYIMRYIKKPVQVSLINNITLELSEHTHDEILDLAIQLALEGIEAKRTQTFTPIVNNKNE